MVKTLSNDLRKAFPQVDSCILDYVQSYLQETPLEELVGKDASIQVEHLPVYRYLYPFLLHDPDYSTDATADGLSAYDQKLQSICRAFQERTVQQLHVTSAHSNTDANNQTTRLLNAPLQMNSMNSVSAAAQYTIPRMTSDVSLVNVRTTTMSLVDRKKLEKADARRAKKLQQQHERDRVLESWGGYVVEEDEEEGQQEDDDMFQQTMMDPSLGKGKTKDIRLENFDISFGGKKILSNTNLTLAHGRRYGLIGRNGVGKSTLLRAIARRTITGNSSKGQGGVPEWLRILHVAQEVHGDDTPVLHSVLQADAYRMTLLRREKEIHSLLDGMSQPGATVTMNTTPVTVEAKQQREQLEMELKTIYGKLQFMEADKAESRASTILSGLGFSPEEQMHPTKSFSGGWRMRISLARALFCRPDVLLLDEPTNHCDINAVIWLEKYLQTWPNTLLVVSHDRDFLDEVATDVLHMHSERIDPYRGNYTLFLHTRNERRKNQLKEYEAQLQYRQHLQAFIDRWRFNAKRAPQAQSKLKILEKLPPLQPPEDDGVEDGEARFRWPDPVDKLSPPILQADEVSFAYPAKDGSGQLGRLILDKVSFNVGLTSRVAIVGPNGAGKSTLLKLLIGELEPTKGMVQRHGRLRVAYFSQHHVDSLEGDEGRALSSVEFLAKRFPGRNEEEYRAILGRFGITGATALQPIRTLSGGQKSRVVFAMMGITNPHILVLDEVSNHLDIMTIDSLVKALNPKTGYQGGMVLVSHDARFIDSVCNEMWVCDHGKITKFVPTEVTLAGGDDEDGEVLGTSGIAEYKKRMIQQIQLAGK